MKHRFTDEQVIGILKEHEAGVTVKELCCNFGMSDATLRRSSSPHDSTVIPVDHFGTYPKNPKARNSLKLRA
ncbi:MAG: transposase [Bacteroidetes bacterium]|jgi:hypothetical protein|nr:transposase [Bacteroidota bacterium]